VTLSVKTISPKTSFGFAGTGKLPKFQIMEPLALAFTSIYGFVVVEAGALTTVVLPRYVIAAYGRGISIRTLFTCSFPLFLIWILY
jgi:hypothetical protein